MVVFGQICCVRAKCLYLGESGCILGKWLYLVKVVEFGQK